MLKLLFIVGSFDVFMFDWFTECESGKARSRKTEIKTGRKEGLLYLHILMFDSTLLNLTLLLLELLDLARCDLRHNCP